ncbi:MAG: hypothetical protein R2716_05125 [Microthrixaceae bacterium]
MTVPVDGTERRYLLTVPDDPSGQPLPLVFDFHGLMEGSEIHSRMTRYSELAGEERFVAVLPEGAGDPLHWELGRDASSNPDLRFFDTMLDQLAGDLCIDLARVYATGLSNGRCSHRCSSASAPRCSPLLHRWRVSPSCRDAPTRHRSRS